MRVMRVKLMGLWFVYLSKGVGEDQVRAAETRNNE